MATRTILATGLSLAAAAAACAQQDAGATLSHVFRPAKVEATDERIATLRCPPGFRVTRFAEDLGNPRFMAVGPDGSVYVTRRENGDVVRLLDRDGDGRADLVRSVLTAPQAHGIAIRGDKLYIATIKEVLSADIVSDGSLSSPTVLIDDLPDGGQHPNRTIAFDRGGAMYITVGSTCNACREPNPEHATILRWRPEGRAREVVATGLRNTIGFAWHPRTGELWGMDHGTDGLGDEHPEEELNRIQEGRDYGWPHVQADGTRIPNVEPPKGITWERLARRSELPVLTYTAHAAPMGMVFCLGSNFPREMQEDALVAMRGSWNRRPAAGYEVVRVRFRDGQPESIEPFVTGFLTDNGRAQFGRPVGLTIAKDGSVLISDDTNGVIYRVTYEGRREGSRVW